MSFKIDVNLSHRLKSGAWSLAVLFILLAAFLLRSWDLEIKPPHFDEGINGNFVSQMWKDGFYRYDPTNFHGPFYFYFLQFAEVLFGRGIWGFRFVTGLISLAAVALLARHRRFIGSPAIWAGLMMALSPAFVFYSRYAIHESLFVFLQIAFVYGWFLWQEKPSRTAMSLMVLGFFGTFAVKETFFIFFGTWGIAWFCVLAYEKVFEKSALVPKKIDVAESESRSDAITPMEILVIWLVGALVAVALFTGFFINPKGFIDMFAAFKFWAQTGTGPTGHEKPFIYWLELLWRYEKAGLLGLIVSPVAFFFVKRHERIVVLTAFGTWLAYSLIPYKTPWLIMNMLWLLFLSLGFAIANIGDWAKSLGGARPQVVRYLLRSLALIAILMGFSSTVQLNFKDHSNPSEPYVYVQTTNQFKVVMDYLSLQIERHPEDLNMRIFVLNKDPWPLPWTLGHFPDLNYGTPETAELTGADVVLADSSAQFQVEGRLSGKYWRVPFQIRDSYQPGFAYLRFDKFLGIVPTESETFGDSNAPLEGSDK